ncbi:hypothetical protein B0H16DRAFT_1890844 [Mycena metata]|uniref:Uncharacterized protein n=1 Tax=Mycena metata TaxID=1033252 RepID=A0AAD7N0B6_9AGAR|nr:hypothetical protein B0H16DRAFT_1890844 [Mycena metata]
MSTPDIPTTLGSMLIGTLFASMFVYYCFCLNAILIQSRLCGAAWIPTILYYRASIRPDWIQTARELASAISYYRLTLALPGVYCLGFRHSPHRVHLGAWGGMWDYFIPYFGDTDNIDHIPWSITLTVALTCIDAFPSSTFCDRNLTRPTAAVFFAHRIFLLSKRNLFMTAPVVHFPSFSQEPGSWSNSSFWLYFGSSRHAVRLIFLSQISIGLMDEFINVDLEDVPLLQLRLVQAPRPLDFHARLAAICDARTNPSGRCEPSNVDPHSSNHIIDKLYAFETGGLTCLATVIAMICWVTMSHNLVFLGLHFVIGKREFTLTLQLAHSQPIPAFSLRELAPSHVRTLQAVPVPPLIRTRGAD